MSMMLDPEDTSLHLVFSFIGHEQGKAIVEDNDKRFLLTILLKCHLILQLLPYSNYLDIFNMTQVH
jgi:hypothetical protein